MSGGDYYNPKKGDEAARKYPLENNAPTPRFKPARRLHENKQKPTIQNTFYIQDGAITITQSIPAEINDSVSLNALVKILEQKGYKHIEKPSKPTYFIVSPLLAAQPQTCNPAPS